MTNNFEVIKNLSKEEMAVFLAMNADVNEYYHYTGDFLEWLNKDSKKLMNEVLEDEEFKKLVKELEDSENEKKS